MAKLARLDVLQDIRDGVQRALDSGEAEAAFKKRMGALLQQKGWWGKKIVVGADGQAEVVQEGSPRRLSTIYRTNLQSAYMAGRWQQFEADADEAPFVQYIAIMDGRTRPGHAKFNGKVFRIDDPAFKVIAPPNGFNCRCRIRNLDARELAARGLRVEDRAAIVERELPVAPVTNKRTGELQPEKLVQRGVSIPDPDRPGKTVTLWADRGWDYNPGAAGLEHMQRLVADKAAQAPHAIGATAIRDMVSGELFARWFAKPEGNFPVALIPEADAARIGAGRVVADFSPESHAKQAANHPELTAADYARVQDIIDAGRPLQDSPVSLVYVMDSADGMASVIKATKTGNGLFLTSLRHLPTDAAERAAEIERLRRKAEKYEKQG